MACRSMPPDARGLVPDGAIAAAPQTDGFAELLSAIVSQQVSVASARAIWQRLQAAGMTDADVVAAASAEELRGLGLSRQKVRYAQALAVAGIDYVALRRAEDAQVVKTLVAVPGIGNWTAENLCNVQLGASGCICAG